MSYKDFFKGKRIAVVGLGEQGSMLADVRFLLKLKARVSMYDMRSREKLGGSHRGSVARQAEILSESAPISVPVSCQFGLMSRLYDVKDRAVLEDELAQFELIILAPDVSRDSGFLKKAVEAGVRIEYPDILLFKLVPSTMLIAVIGSAGKTTVARMIHEVLTKALRRSFYIDVEAGGALSTLKNIKKDDCLVARMPEHLMDEYRDARITPHIAVLTYISKSLARLGKKFFGILEFQTYNSFIVASDMAVEMLKDHGGFQPRAKIIRTRSTTILPEWHIKASGMHARENVALAVEAVSIFKIDPDTIHLALSAIKHLKGRIERVRISKKGIEFYNDSMSVRPEATLAALRFIGEHDGRPSIVLVIGGSYTEVSYDELFEHMTQYVSYLIVMPGSGSLIMRSKIEKLGIPISYVKSVTEVVARVREVAGRGDSVLFSPAFDIVGQFESRQSRGEEFVKAVKEAY